MRRTRIVSTALATLALVATSLPASGQAGGVAGFDDVDPSNVHAEAIEEGVALGLLNGTSATTFSPSRSLTRAQAASLLARTIDELGVELPGLEGAPTFTDTAPPHEDAIRRLAAADIVFGVGGGRFNPSGHVTREQLASLVVRTVGFVTGSEVVPAGDNPFSDVDPASLHGAAVVAAAELGLLQGRTDGTFNPRGPVRRDQSASVIVRTFYALDGLIALTTGGEVWVLDQGTDLIHIYDGDGVGFEEIVTLDVRPSELRRAGFDVPVERVATVPHMIAFDSQERYAFIASTAGGITIIVDAVAKRVVEVLDTGPGTHMADVTPDDSALWISVIGTAGRVSNDSQRFVEVPLDLDAEEPEFEIGRVIYFEDALLDFEADEDVDWLYPSFSPVCHQYTPDSAEAWITLGPGSSQGGLVVVDLAAGEISAGYDPGVVKANCGVSVTGDYVVVNWSGDVLAPVDGVSQDTPGEWYVIDTETKELLDTRDAEGLDAHGIRLTPDGSSYWMVNRGSDNALVVDAETFEVTRRYEDLAVTPDIIDYSPDGGLVYITQRGPTPRSGAIHSAQGDDPGVAVVHERSGTVLGVLKQATLVSPGGQVLNDVHGAGVRSRTAEDATPAEAQAANALAATAASLDAPRPEPQNFAGFGCGI